MADIGRILIFLGLILALLGGIVLLAGKIPGLGRLPGDILIQRRNVTFYFPIATSILISIVLSLIFWLLSRR
ncbi:MAG: DUF2905 domain-containing protein [Candidatus Manganitrophus sp.]|jgi:hypothetical protein|nr:DUF2905 domain-containing protein [Candidatus Manganitrophus morganii]MDC4204985.1 DUF2905 domain-containing protein [Candidatus Manganitrophus sp.]MDC4224764.1 DUF2905 domain-containing protein [Candidatus Manganitrophus sp.]WDT70354.1 MAG: DUF2905 domain-containing protein [Candidatus Manganitrophus sp.]WDT77381.1 MAG: DUF2905 domain-containing protein [Candidatus Manganitrophus sp.]